MCGDENVAPVGMFIENAKDSECEHCNSIDHDYLCCPKLVNKVCSKCGTKGHMEKYCFKIYVLPAIHHINMLKTNAHALRGRIKKPIVR